MTHSYSTSVLQFSLEIENESKKAYRSYEPNNFTFQICVIDFDGDAIDFNLEAQNYSDANDLAISYCSSYGIDIYDMQIYLLK